MIDLQQLQKEVFENKIAKGFNTTNVGLEFILAHEELSEAFRAYRKKLPDLGEELADVTIYLLGLAAILHVNLEQEIIKKVEKNRNRKYQKIDGVLKRTKDE
jgi:NTP pyrophosphatase (non-canonical NTP hydrolase)